MKRIINLFLTALIFITSVSVYAYEPKTTTSIDCLDREYTFIDSEEYVYFTSGSNYFAAIRPDGSLWMWGSNEEGQLGIGDVRNSYNAPVKVLENVEKVFAENDNTIAIKKDGSVWGFGEIIGSKPAKLADNAVSASLSKDTLAVVEKSGRAYMKNINNSEVTELTNSASEIKIFFNSMGITNLTDGDVSNLTIEESVKLARQAPMYILLIKDKSNTVYEYKVDTRFNVSSSVFADNVEEMTVSYYYSSCGYYALRKSDGTILYGTTDRDAKLKSTKEDNCVKVYNSPAGLNVLKSDGSVWNINTQQHYGDNVKLFAVAGGVGVWMMHNDNSHSVDDTGGEFKACYNAVNYGNESVSKKDSDIMYEDIYAKTMEIIGGETDKYTQAKLVSEWIYTNIKYERSYHDQSGVEAFRTGTGVCAAFAGLTTLMLGYLDIPVYAVVDTSHAWNIAIIDGVTVFIDNTSGWFDYDNFRNNSHEAFVYSSQYYDEWAANEIRGAYDYEIIDGNLGSDFKAAITRQQFCSLIRSVIERTTNKNIDTVIAEKGKSGIEVSFTDTAEKDVHDLYKLGIVKGISDTEFAPRTTITRQEAAVIMKGLSEFFSKDVTAASTNFADQAEIDWWATDAVAYTAQSGIMKGKTHGFAPKDTISIQESIIICFRYFNENKGLRM